MLQDRDHCRVAPHELQFLQVDLDCFPQIRLCGRQALSQESHTVRSLINQVQLRHYQLLPNSLHAFPAQTAMPDRTNQVAFAIVELKCSLWGNKGRLWHFKIYFWAFRRLFFILLIWENDKDAAVVMRNLQGHGLIFRDFVGFMKGMYAWMPMILPRLLARRGRINNPIVEF